MITSREDLCDYRIIHQKSIEEAKRTALAPERVNQLAQVFKAIADPGRINILKALEEQEMCVCDLAAFLGVSESAVSHQLRQLRQLELVTNRREGAVLYYRLNKTIANYLLDIAIKHFEEE